MTPTNLESKDDRMVGTLRRDRRPAAVAIGQRGSQPYPYHILACAGTFWARRIQLRQLVLSHAGVLSR